MKRGDLLFLDTNIFLSATDASRAEHGSCRSILERAIAAGLRPSTELDNVSEFQTCAHLLPDSVEVTRHLLALVKSANLSGKRIHDANIAAVMIIHGVTTIATANIDDYAGLPGVTSRTPADTLFAIDALIAG